ncbi:MAG: acetate--CoA ligase family protein [Alphaproteobacteria bacterium]
MSQHRLQPLLEPKSIAVVGASPREKSFARNVMQGCLTAGFDGDLHLVNPRYDEIDGRPCYPGLGAVPGPLDHALLVVANERLEAVVEEAIKADVKAVSIFSSCYLPDDTDPPLLERLRAMTHEAGVQVCGGNGSGFYNRDHEIRCSLGNKAKQAPGDVSVISQSGSIYQALMENDGRLNFNFTVSSGQEISTTTADYMDYVLDLPTTKAIALFIETIRDPDGFIAATKRAAELDIPIVAVKCARSEAAKAMAVSHSGALAGDDDAYNALFERYGVIRCTTMSDMFATLQVMTQTPRAAPGGVAAITDSGGEREYMTDEADRIGVPFAKINDATSSRLEARLEYGLDPVNPLDAWGTGNDYVTIFLDCMTALMEDPDTGFGLWVADIRDAESYRTPFVENAPEISRKTGKPMAFVTCVPNGDNQRNARLLKESGMPMLEEVGPAMTAIRNSFAYRDWQARPASTPPAAPGDEVIATWRERLANGAPFGEAEGLELLDSFGVPANLSTIATTRDGAIAAAGAMGGPVALKTAEPSIRHKSDVGGVVLGLDGDDAVGAAYDDMAERLGSRVVISPMAPSGVELAFGMVNDPQFGPLVMISAGGILVEVMSDACFALAPFDTAEAHRLIDRLTIRKLLDGVRGKPAANVDAVAEALARFSVLAAALGDAIDEIDVNPIIAGPDGCRAVDALVVPRVNG